MDIKQEPDLSEDETSFIVCTHKGVGRIDIKQEPDLSEDETSLTVCTHQGEGRMDIKQEPDVLKPRHITCINLGERNPYHIEEERKIHIIVEPEIIINEDFVDIVGSVLMACFHCSHTSASLGRLRKHIVWRHISAVSPQLDIHSTSEDNNARSLMTNVQKPFQCLFCSYSFRQTGHLKKHMLVHTGEKPFHCMLCNYSSRKLDLLKLHMLVHSEEKPFQCKNI